MYQFLKLFLFVLISVYWLSSPGAQTTPSNPAPDETVWLHFAFAEINSASPVIGEATFPISLAQKVVAALPPKTVKECQESGFDIPKIAEAVNQLKTGEKYQNKTKEYQLKISKIPLSFPTEAKATYLAINNPKFPIKVPLSMTALAVKMLQLYDKDLKDMGPELTKVVEEIQKTPPAVLLKGEDKLMDSWLEISLE